MNQPQPTVAAILPARMASSRFPGKPLAPILGRPMIEHVYRRTAMAESVDRVYVATCDEEIRDAVESFGGMAIMTSPTHERASDRVAEAAETIDADIVVMVQGDEPMVTPDMVQAAIAPMIQDPTILCVNLLGRIHTEEEFDDRNTVKVVVDGEGRALFFSREPIPTRRFQPWGDFPAFKQVCIIPFRREFLAKYSQLPPTPLEVAESVDMLRCLEHGLPVHMVPFEGRSHAVDTSADLEKVERILAKDELTHTYLDVEGKVPS